LLDALRVELRPHGIAVTTLCPGWIRTDLTRSAPIRAKMMEVDEAVRQMLPALRQRKALHAFPAPAKWTLRLLRSLPLSASDWLTMRYVSRQVRK
jgi:short-subunit dehydrogenase